jgi:uncharacterized membrane protein
VSTGRLEAFSDGVLAVAITLLVLDLKASTDRAAGSLAHQLGHDWASFAAYAVSFLVIGTIWVNHNALFALAARVDRVLMFYNLLLLLFVTTIPFTTSTYASFLRHGGSDARVAVLVYGASNTGMAVGFTLILARLVRHNMTIRPVTGNPRSVIARFGLGVLLYPLVSLISLAWPPLMLIIYLLLAVYYMFEQTPFLRTQGASAEPG